MGHTDGLAPDGIPRGKYPVVAPISVSGNALLGNSLWRRTIEWYVRVVEFGFLLIICVQTMKRKRYYCTQKLWFGLVGGLANIHTRKKVWVDPICIKILLNKVIFIRLTFFRLLESVYGKWHIWHCEANSEKQGHLST